MAILMTIFTVCLGAKQMTKYRNFRPKSDGLPQGQQFAVGIYKLLPEASSDPQVSLTTCGGGGWWLYDPSADGV
ncbi:MAG: hypothetical protein ACJATI_004814 [Halioglobus sp.]|jgi:hypothetical protein|tara:strand:- start:1868 stop:2089 length:222 start_codon:yes stop_codon:yes gene_type:complete